MTKWRLCSPPPGGGGALAVVQLTGEIDAALATMGIGAVKPGAVCVRTLGGVDHGVVARIDDSTALLMPHAGPAVVRRLIEALRAAGIAEQTDASTAEQYPEAADVFEARMLAALARAHSPLAIDLLLDQPRRWRAAERERAAGGDAGVADRSRVLNRLIDPPLVVALGRPNIGKSSLLNALAGRGVSLVADEPGTTRDHVGVQIDLGGLVVRYVDAPGIDATSGVSSIDAAAQEVALRVAGSADLVLLMGDAASAPLSPATVGLRADRTMAVALRADLGVPTWSYEVAVSARTGSAVPLLVDRVRERLVPRGMREDPGLWRFWDEPAG